MSGSLSSSEDDGANEGLESRVPVESVFYQSRSNEWYTPGEVLDAVRELFMPGAIDLDPCSTVDANERIRATAFYDRDSDGLATANPWSGNVFVNPPFGVRAGASLQGLFFKRCMYEYAAGTVTQAVVLLKSAVGYEWFRAVYDYPHCFLSARLSFVRPVAVAAAALEHSGGLHWGSRLQNPHGSVVVYLGPNLRRFAGIFGRMGSIPGFKAWSLAENVPSGDG